MLARRFLLGIAITLTTSAVQAHPQYPVAIRRHLGLSKDPACTTCHETNPGRKGNATKPFAVTLKQLGMAADSPDTQSLVDALDEDDGCEIDSDGDGVLDIDELLARTDPNDGHGERTSTCSDSNIYTGPLPQNGCAMSRANNADAWFASVALASALFAFRKRVRIRRRHGA